MTSIDPLLRLAVQRSSRFVITSIGNPKRDARLMRITGLQRNSGEYRAGSKQHKGQRVAADYCMDPQIAIDDSPVGGIGSMIGGLTGDSAVSMLAGSVKTKASVVMLTLFDIRSAVWIAAAEGSSTTPEGKATVVAFSSTHGTSSSSRCAIARRRT
ncbi:hypothetical protein WT08_10165 [Burkholderia sp. MSMB1552]|nr:hypothetical protein WT08_10165 [Burkholderia sp. MSMB1552]KWZ54936.1 hypothetical protein WS92_02705 [Burkholderia sp. MSMB1588]